MTAKVIAFPAEYIQKSSPAWDRAGKAMTAIRAFNQSTLAACIALNLACIGVSIFIVCTVLLF